jgi:Raf kinase inhibitor-like YbhB/YbcL family protein
MLLTSSAFGDGDEIPLRHAQRTFDDPGGWTVTCPGENVSPPLGWSNVPSKAESLVITCYDHITLCEKCKPLAPRGRVWGHWGIYNIPPTSSGLAEGLSADSVLPDGSRQVVNEYNEVGYGGPCPPPEHVHSYVFTLYTLDTMLDLPEEASVAELSVAMEGHILAQVDLTGIFVGR